MGLISSITLRKMRFRQKTGFLIKTTCIEKLKCTRLIVVLILTETG